ncbi:LacI family DNA-binding transcriptional regulator [Gordonia sp. zg691]|uniref:LacI family DNA-binding transcriptional regulator n=1 Tax=Gordonia jinghuaiqii TaxID=2758710 RepID=A0A7D7LUA5_9ACTN|nr:LacI family DNA-binding transcriptional regulator [Gordonia jinghuaiqii]MBD0862933.1 LacI family DNA-binding transcriptional regulator [Gordonia jinghuaiqii]QMT01721.1 LacI family DNA-binding transcriptional regulator [Gordonia jinghuaiqii]
MKQPGPKHKRPTIKDVAEHARVSVSTVSYVLNDSGPVAPERRNRVLDAVRVLEYSPNESARNLKRRGASRIGMVVPELTNQFFAMVTEGVQRAASARDVLVVLVIPDAAARSEEEQAKLLRSQRIDGVVYLSGTGSMPAASYELARSGPVVLVDEQIPGIDLPAVVCDSRKGAREAAMHVLDHGHRQIAVIGGPPALWTAQQRLAGYREAFAGVGLDPDAVPVYHGDYQQDSGYEAAKAALIANPRPSALICANDLMAVGAMEYCREAGLQMPDEVSIVGFDDLALSRLLTPRLTSVRQPAHDMGFRAANVLFDLIENDEPEQLSILPTTLQIRSSVSQH